MSGKQKPVHFSPLTHFSTEEEAEKVKEEERERKKREREEEERRELLRQEERLARGHAHTRK